MNLLSAVLFIAAATTGLTTLFVALNVYLDGRDARRDARRRNQATRL